jgi:hypothetical protein
MEKVIGTLLAVRRVEQWRESQRGLTGAAPEELAIMRCAALWHSRGA